MNGEIMIVTFVVGLAICHLLFWLEGDYDDDA